MNVTLCSAFRNASGYIGRYFKQINCLQRAFTERGRGDRLHYIWGEGDHTDDTRLLMEIASELYSADLVSVNHGGPDHGSVVNAERFANIAKVVNAIWQRIPEDADAVLYVESDLIWEPCTMLHLLDRLAEYPAIAPMVMLQREGWPQPYFYDTWAGRKDGKHISPLPPYFPGWDMTEPLQVDSMGSCMALRGKLARELHWPSEDVFVGLCRLTYEHGYSVWLDPKVSVIHP